MDLSAITIPYFGVINLKAFFIGMLTWGAAILGIIIGGILIAAIWYWRSLKNKKSPNLKNIIWYRMIKGKTTPINLKDPDAAEEILVPGTGLRLFYIEKSDTYMPRLKEEIDKDIYFAMLAANGRIINFTLQSYDEAMRSVGLEFDRADNLWDVENAREFVKRNYTDKSIKWWQAYQQVISNAIHIILHTITLVVIIYFMKKFFVDITTSINGLLDRILPVAQAIGANPGSGIATVAAAMFLSKPIEEKR